MKEGWRKKKAKKMRFMNDYIKETSSPMITAIPPLPALLNLRSIQKGNTKKKENKAIN